MNGKRVGAVLAAAFLLVSASSFAVEPTHLARRGADDGEEGRHERNRGGRGGVETAPAGTLADPGAKALFEAKCSICHSLNRPLRKSRERKWWAETVTRMQKVNRCPITDGEARAIIDYLATVRGPGAPRGPGDDEEHHRDQRAPATQGEQGAGPDVPPAGGGDPEARALFESKCSVCHPLSRPLGKNKDRAGWTATVTRMQKGNGCPITDAEARRIIDYLVAERGPTGK